MRLYDAEQEENIEEEYQVLNISSAEFTASIEFLKETFDIILVEFPGSLKQDGVIQTLMMMDIVINPFETSPISVMHTLNFYNYYKENILF